MSATDGSQREGMGLPVDVSALVAPGGGPVPWFSAVLELTEVALVLVQAQGVRYANPAARRLLAWDDGPLEDHQLTDWVAPEDRSLIAEQLRRRLAGEPLQYVMGRWAFRHLDLMVDPLPVLDRLGFPLVRPAIRC